MPESTQTVGLRPDISTPKIENIGQVSSDNGVDIEALRNLSIAEYDKEYGGPANEKRSETKTSKDSKSKQKETRSSDSDSEDKDLAGSEEDDDDDGDEDAEPEIDTEFDEGEDEEGEGEGDSDGDGEEDEDAEITKKPVSKKPVIIKTKNGEEVKFSRSDKVIVPINGKLEEVPLADVIDKASGNIHLDREFSRLHTEKKDFEKHKTEFHQTESSVTENLEMLRTIAEHGSPNDFIYYYASLSGQNPEAVLQKLTENVIQYLERQEKMTPRERELEAENRKYKFAQILTQKRGEESKKQQALREEGAKVETRLKQEALTWDDWEKAALEIKERLERKELPERQYNAHDVVDYAVFKRHNDKVSKAIERVNKEFLKDPDFFDRVSKGVARTEHVTGKRLSSKETRRFVRALLAKNVDALSENLSKKVDRQNKTGKTTSEKAALQKKKKNEDVGALTLEDHREKWFGGH